MSAWPTQQDCPTDPSREDRDAASTPLDRLPAAPDRDRPAISRRGFSGMASFYPPLVVFLAAMLFVRVLTDDRSSATSRQSGSINLSSVIALVFILLAVYMLFRWRRGVLPTLLAGVWLCVWMAIAVHTSGASAETLREGVREVSVVALFAIVYNARGTVTVPIAARIVQLIAVIPAIVAVYQLTTFTGKNRPYGTFAHPDSAAMYLAIAAVASLWLYLDSGRRWLDALLTALLALAAISTASIDGLITLVCMLIVYGALRPGSYRAKLIPCAIAAIVAMTFIATPLGSHRLTSESATSLTGVEHEESNTSFDWRLHKWKSLLPQWESSPIVGKGLGVTTTTPFIPGNKYSGKPPHNEYVRYLVETGIIGLAILLAAVSALGRYLVRMRRRPGKTIARISGATSVNTAIEANVIAASTLGLTILTGCLINSLADNTLLNSPTCYAAALIIASVVSLPAIYQRGMLDAQTRNF
jgi:O-antigen ligase